MAQETVIIRKYENRRLYDTAASRYVNLEEVAEMVRQGIDVRVVDAKSGEDLTRLILAQIIMEDAKGRQSTLPLDFLRQMVIASGRASQENFARYMKAMFDTYQNAYEAFQSRFRGAGPISLPFDLMQAIFNPNAPGLASSWSHTPPRTAKAEEAPPPEPPRSGDELTELRNRIAELERRLTEEPRSKPGNRARRNKNN